jgi:hypothetical protein
MIFFKSSDAIIGTTGVMQAFGIFPAFGFLIHLYKK